MSGQSAARKENGAVIIGGEIMGCATAYSLAMRGPRVTPLEKGRLAFLIHSPSLGGLKIEGTWAGVIDRTTDRQPVPGPVTAAEGFWFATGHGGHGFGMGPPTAT